MADKKTFFISYSSNDAEIVDRILAVLTELGMAYWKAPEMIPAGSNYAREIPQAIKSCDIFLLLVSKYSQASIWVEKEVDSAINSHKHIIPVLLDDMPLNDMYKFYLNNIQMLIFRDEQRAKERFKAQLLEAMKSVKLPKTSVYEQTLEEERKEQIKRRAVFNLNKAPVECRYCKGELEETSPGVYVCIRCKGENYDYFRTVRNFLAENGPHTAIEIERKTGVPRKVVASFLDDGLVEISGAHSFRIRCQSCGAMIRSGMMCDKCMKMISPRNNMRK